MASTSTRSKLYYLGRAKVSQVVSSILVLGLVIWVFRYIRQPSYGTVGERANNAWMKQASDSEIKSYLSYMIDTRPDHCAKGKIIDEAEAGPVSIIIDFNEDQFYALKMTLQSVLKHTPDHLYKEILILDDGTTSPEVRAHAAKYMDSLHSKKIQGYRSDDFEGSSLARFKASKIAAGSTLVFLHSSVAVNTGWLPPLLKAVHNKPNSIVVPHFDTFLTGYEFHQLADDIVNTFSWSLTTVFLNGQSDPDGHLTTPVMTGHAFATSREFLDHIGSYDDHLLQGGGENLELSIRTWLCGGSIRVQSCSRVAMKDALRILPVTSVRNFRHITELWLNEYKSVAYKQSGFQSGMSDQARLSFQTRKSYLKRFVQCKPFAWFLDNVAQGIVVPTNDVKQFGKLRAKSGRCITGTHSAGEKPIVMEPCRPNFHESRMMLELNKRSQIRNGENCLELASDDTLSFAICLENRKRQLWDYTSAGLIKSMARDNQCLTHVTTSPEPGTHEHRLVSKPCTEDNRNQMWTFVRT